LKGKEAQRGLITQQRGGGKYIYFAILGRYYPVAKDGRPFLSKEEKEAHF